MRMRRLFLVLLAFVAIIAASEASNEPFEDSFVRNSADAASGMGQPVPDNANFDQPSSGGSIPGWTGGGGQGGCTTEASGGVGYLAPNSAIYSSTIHLVSNRIEVPYEWYEDDCNVGGAVFTGHNIYITVYEWCSGGWNCVHSTAGFSCDPCTNTGGVLVANIDAADIGKIAQIKLAVTAYSQPTIVDNVAFNVLEHEVPQAHAGDPFNTTTGSFTHSHTDLAIPGKGIPLEFTRTYQSLSSRSGDLGEKWTHNYAWSLWIDPDSSVMVSYPSGHSEYFTYSAGSFTADTGIFDTLVKNGDNTYTLTTVDAVKYNFSTTGLLTSIVDRNGYTTTLNRTGTVLTSVTDPGGRSVTLVTGTAKELRKSSTANPTQTTS